MKNSWMLWVGIILLSLLGCEAGGSEECSPDCEAGMVCWEGECRYPCSADFQCPVQLPVCGSDGYCQAASGCEPSREVCDGRDNDCDGTVDEGCLAPDLAPDASSDPGSGADTHEDADAAEDTREDAGGDVGVEDTPVADTGAEDTPSAVEICNGIDDDGDHAIDEGCPCENGSSSKSYFRSCGFAPPANYCYYGTQWCLATYNVYSECLAGTPIEREECDFAFRMDVDCDGLFNDEDPDCESAYASTSEICDGWDNDCDGETDEGDCVAVPGCSLGERYWTCPEDCGARCQCGFCKTVSLQVICPPDDPACVIYYSSAGGTEGQPAFLFQYIGEWRCAEPAGYLAGLNVNARAGGPDGPWYSDIGRLTDLEMTIDGAPGICSIESDTMPTDSYLVEEGATANLFCPAEYLSC